jgi:tRNA 2-thiouridine synthesizing protein A
MIKIMIEIDIRGLACPIPVVRTQKAMKENPKQEIAVLCDSTVAKENVSRLAENNNYTVSVTIEGNDFKIILKP